MSGAYFPPIVAWNGPATSGFLNFSRSNLSLGWVRFLKAHHPVMITSYVCFRKVPSPMDVNSGLEPLLHQTVVNLVVNAFCLGCAMFTFWIVCVTPGYMSVKGCKFLESETSLICLSSAVGSPVSLCIPSNFSIPIPLYIRSLFYDFLELLIAVDLIAFVSRCHCINVYDDGVIGRSMLFKGLRLVLWRLLANQIALTMSLCTRKPTPQKTKNVTQYLRKRLKL